MRSQRLLFAGWVVWACFVISHYYVQLPRVVIAGRTTLSLSAAIALCLPVLLLGAIVALQRTRRGLSGRSATCYTLSAALARATRIALVSVALTVVPWLLLWPLLITSLSTISLPGLPWFGEAAGRVFVAVTGAALVGAATMAAGARVLDALKGRSINRVEYLVFAWTCGVGVISYASLLLALLGIYRPLTVALLIAAALLSASPKVRRLRAGVLQLPALPSLRPAAAAWVGLILVALAYGLVAAIAPEKEYDAVWYHLYLPRTWLAAGRPVDIVHEFVSLYPLTWELLFAAGVTLGGIVGAKLLHFICLPLLGLLVWQTTRRFFPHASGVAAAALVITTPTVLWQSSTAYVDLALALHATAGCYALARYAEQNERAWGAIAALQLGLTAATKHLGLIVTGIALALYVIGVLRRTGSVKPTLRRALLIGALALAIPSPWYARSWMASGNPVFPEMYGVFGAAPSERWDAISERELDRFKARFGRGRSPRDLLALPWDVTIHAASFGGSLGPLFLALIPGLACASGLAWGGSSRRSARWVIAGLVLYVAVWASPISSYQLRFLVPIVPALGLLAATSLAALERAAANLMRHGSGMLLALILILAVMNLPPFTRLHETDREGWNGFLTHVLRGSPIRVAVGRESEPSYLAREILSYKAWQWINAHVPADGRILTTTGGDQLYSERARLAYDATLARPAVWVSVAELDAATAAQRRLGITHVLFDRRELSRLTPDATVLASQPFQQACTTEYSDRRFVLCRIDYSRLPSPGSARGE
jgi:hypothetical protein